MDFSSLKGIAQIQNYLRKMWNKLWKILFCSFRLTTKCVYMNMRTSRINTNSNSQSHGSLIFPLSEDMYWNYMWKCNSYISLINFTWYHLITKCEGQNPTAVIYKMWQKFITKCTSSSSSQNSKVSLQIETFTTKQEQLYYNMRHLLQHVTFFYINASRQC